MGTFTLSYWARTAIWEKKHLWIASVGGYWFGRCWTNAGSEKSSMMKGHSKMYADRIASIPANADPWKY